MKFKTTAKAIREGFNNVKCAGYCDLQYLLRGTEPVAYTAGIYGWNFDVYRVHGITICTGYRGMPGARLEAIAEYEAKARAIWSEYKMPYEEQQQKTFALLEEFCKLNGGY